MWLLRQFYVNAPCHSECSNWKLLIAEMNWQIFSKGFFITEDHDFYRKTALDTWKFLCWRGPLIQKGGEDSKQGWGVLRKPKNVSHICAIASPWKNILEEFQDRKPIKNPTFYIYHMNGYSLGGGAIIRSWSINNKVNEKNKRTSVSLSKNPTNHNKSLKQGVWKRRWTSE